MEGRNFGGEIARLRVDRGYTIREFAKKVIKEDQKPMSASYLCDIEQGRKNPPSVVVIRRMAEELEADFDRLMDLAERTPPDIKEMLQGNEEARKMLRKAKQAGFRDWKEVEKLIESRTRGSRKDRKK
jgi:transcriptional regulator with XRE-family HTH domain